MGGARAKFSKKTNNTQNTTTEPRRRTTTRQSRRQLSRSGSHAAADPCPTEAQGYSATRPTSLSANREDAAPWRTPPLDQGRRRRRRAVEDGGNEQRSEAAAVVNWAARRQAS